LAESQKTAKDTGKATRTAATEAAPKKKRFSRKPVDVVTAYFDAVDRHDLDAMVTCWKPGGIDRIAPIGELTVPEGLRAFFGELFAAVPDIRFERLDVVSEGDKVVVRWRSVGTFCGGPFQGIAPTGARLDLEGADVLTVEDGLIRRNDAYYDGTQFARQIGLLPPLGSSTERRMTAAFNARTRVGKRLFGLKKERVADGVWVLRGGFPVKTMNVFLIEDEGGVTMYDGGIAGMANGIAAETAALGGLKRVVLGHSHADHRGSVPKLGAEVFCHPAEEADAVSDGGEHYFDYSKLKHTFARLLMPRLVRWWDGGPVRISGHLKEGDVIAGFKVVHLPGHAPGLIGLWRDSDRLALVSDTLYTLDPETGIHGPPRVPSEAFNKDTEQARASIRKLAELEPAVVWPGHADPLRGDVRAQLERAAATT
jgi:hydroxyacylglutathione hydrolase